MDEFELTGFGAGLSFDDLVRRAASGDVQSTEKLIDAKQFRDAESIQEEKNEEVLKRPSSVHTLLSDAGLEYKSDFCVFGGTVPITLDEQKAF